MSAQNPVKSVNRLKRALLKSQALTSVPIEVFIFSNTTKSKMTDRLQALALEGVSIPGQAIIAVDPVRRHVAVALSPEIEDALDKGELRAWLQGLQDDLHMTFFENAVALAVLSLSMAFSTRFPAQAPSE